MEIAHLFRDPTKGASSPFTHIINAPLSELKEYYSK